MSENAIETENYRHEIGYRSGYNHGVAAAVFTLKEKLSLEEQNILSKWQDRLLEWQGPLGMARFDENADPERPPAIKPFPGVEENN